MTGLVPTGGRLLVCGGREFKSLSPLFEALDRLRPHHIIHGDAPGADRLAECWAKNREVPYTGYPAQWKLHGKAAGPLRNKRMLEEGNPDRVLATPGGDGTANMIKQAKAKGLTVLLLEEVCANVRGV